MASASPELLELLAQVQELKNVYANARIKAGTKMRGKYEQALQTLMDSELPYIKLDNTQFPNASQSSLQQSFNRASDKLKVKGYSVVCLDNDEKLLIDFDNDRAEETFNEYIASKAGITKEELAAITADLDAATKDKELVEA